MTTASTARITNTLDSLRWRYSAQLDDHDPRVAAVARAQLDTIARATYLHDHKRPPGPSPWAWADLAVLFEEQGNKLTPRATGRIVTGHKPRHGSRSGACVVIWPESGRFYCSSCRRSGDALSYLMETTGATYRWARAELTARFGVDTEARS